MSGSNINKSGLQLNIPQLGRPVMLTSTIILLPIVLDLISVITLLLVKFAMLNTYLAITAKIQSDLNGLLFTMDQ